MHSVASCVEQDLSCIVIISLFRHVLKVLPHLEIFSFAEDCHSTFSNNHQIDLGCERSFTKFDFVKGFPVEAK